MIKRERKIIPSLITATLLSTSIYGAGFAIIENSASGMGSAFSSGGAAGEDASTVWFNPASMSLLKGQNFMMAGHVIIAKADFTNNGSTYENGDLLTGPNSEGGKNAFVPNLYYVGQVTDEIHLGISINAPFGLGTKYDDDWVGRYHAVDTELTTININPAISYAINGQWSIGAGVSVQYVDLTLTSAIDEGAIMGAPGTSDGFAELQADNKDKLSYGWNVGLLYNLSETTRFSLAYRSAIDHHAEGTADFTNPATSSAIISTGAFADTTLSSDVTLPASASFSVFHAIDESFDIMGDVTWTQWSVFDELRITYADGSNPSESVTTENYQDQWRVAVGGRYHYSKELIFRSGLAYDQKAVQSAEYRTARIPDNDRYWLSLGMGYAFSEMIGMDLGYSHLFIPDTHINNTFESDNIAVQHTLTGDYEASVDIFSAQLTVKF
jgi:long-chain fatty acid transport protein